MKVTRCIACGTDYKTEPHPRALITHGLCGNYCKQSAKLWVHTPEPRKPLRRFHHERKAIKAVA